MFKKWMMKRTADKYFNEGINLLLQGKNQRAVERFTEVVEMDPMLLGAYLHRGIAYYQLEDMARVFPDLDFVILHRPDSPKAYYWRSRAYMDMGKTDLALADINKAAKLDLYDDEILAFRCFVHLYCKEYNIALEDATKLIQIGYEEGGYNNRAIVYLNMGNYQAAIDDLTRVIALNPDSADAYCQRGILLEKVGQIERAISDLKMGLKNKNDLSESLRLESEKLLNKLQKRKR